MKTIVHHRPELLEKEKKLMSNRKTSQDSEKMPETRTAPDFSKYNVCDSYCNPVTESKPPGERRRPNRRQLHKNSPFMTKIICSECGSFYGRKVWHSGSKYRSHIWRCNRKYQHGTPCATPNLLETEIEDAFVVAFNQLLGDKDQYIAQFEKMLPLLADTSELEERLHLAQAEHDTLMEELRQYMAENTRIVQDQVEYNRRYAEKDEACKRAEAEIANIQKHILAQQGRKEQIRRCLNELRKCGDILTDFDFALWNIMVDTVTVSMDKTLTFRLFDGTEVVVGILK